MMEPVKERSRWKVKRKPVEDMEEVELLNMTANMICNAVAWTNMLIMRTEVFRKRSKTFKRRLIERLQQGDDAEAYAYAASILLEKRRSLLVYNLSERVILFTNFFRATIANVTDELLDRLNKISYLISNGFLFDLNKEVTKCENEYNYNKTGKKVKADKCYVSHKSVKKYMKRVMQDPKVASALTMDSIKKSTSTLKSDKRKRSKPLVFRV